MADDVPILRTPRLVLRAHRLEDFETKAAMWSLAPAAQSTAHARTALRASLSGPPPLGSRIGLPLGVEGSANDHSLDLGEHRRRHA